MGSTDPFRWLADDAAEVRDDSVAGAGSDRRVRPLPRPRLPTKLEQPAVDAELVHRSRLVDELVHSSAAPLVVILAPPGYGKTTLLTQWSAADPRRFSWIRLDEDDNDPAVLLMYLAGAIARGGADADVLSGPIDDAEFLATVAVPRLGQVLRSQPEPFVLVLDDTQVLTGPSWKILAFLVHEMPTGSQLVLAGRSVPELGLGHLLTHRRLLQLGPEDLVMGVEEARLVARAVGVELDPSAAGPLVRRTEGWPAGLYLAALSVATSSLRDGSDVAFAAQAFTGADRLVTDYVRDEVLTPAGEEIRSFLLRTSILRALTSSLCDAVLDARGSSELLAEINQTNGLLLPLGRGRDWYRYHQLFADVLRSELHRLEPETEIELHRRASVWYEQHAEPDEAISHAHAAGDEQRAAELVWREVGTRFASGRHATLERWLAGFDGRHVVRDPLLALTAAACALAAGRSVTEWLSTAQHAIDRPLSLEGRNEHEVALAVAIFHTVMGRRGALRMMADTQEIDRLAPAGSPAHALASFFRGVAADLTGNDGRARTHLREGAVSAGRAALPTVQALCLAYLAYLDCLEEDWQGVGVLTAQARGLMEAARAEDFVTMASVHATVSLALAHEHRFVEAERAAREALRLQAAVAPIAPWLDVHTRAVLARTHLLLGDPAAARMLLAEAQQTVDLVPDAPELRHQLDRVWEMVQNKPLSTRVGPSSITPAELRVLRLLPTHLSFAEISDQLFLTRNTVKTQAISTYRKLGVSSRGDAVTQARLLGLIPPVQEGNGGTAPHEPAES